MQSQNQPFVNASSSSSSSHHQSRSEQEQVWTRQIPAASTTTTTTMSESSRFGSNPEPLPARSGRATTVRVTSPNGDRDPSSSSRHNSSHNNTSHNKLENKSGHTPTGSHRVLLKLRRGAQAARPKSVHGAEQVMASCEQYNKCDRFNMSADLLTTTPWSSDRWLSHPDQQPECDTNNINNKVRQIFVDSLNLHRSRHAPFLRFRRSAKVVGLLKVHPQWVTLNLSTVRRVVRGQK